MQGLICNPHIIYQHITPITTGALFTDTSHPSRPAPSSRTHLTHHYWRPLHGHITHGKAVHMSREITATNGGINYALLNKTGHVLKIIEVIVFIANCHYN